MNSIRSFREVVLKIISSHFNFEGLRRVPLQIRKEISLSEESALQELAITFLILLSGENHTQYQVAKDKWANYINQQSWQEVIRFFTRGLEEIPREIKRYSKDNPEFEKKLNKAVKNINREKDNQILSNFHAIFFPEGLGLDEEKERLQKVSDLRSKRTIKIERLNRSPLMNPAREIIFTSNILLTIPLNEDQENWHVSEALKPSLQKVRDERQKYWYDHPIPLGIEPQKNEILYGLRGLQEMMEFEIENHLIPADSRLTVILSASATHEGLHPLINAYFASLLREAVSLPQLDLYVFSEDDTKKLLDDVLIPLAERYFPGRSTAGLSAVFGVDGEYGRHYSFLKAITAIWQVFMNPQIKATFKIDLDQVFSQQELLEQSGSSALQHFCTPLWGATGRDEQDREVELAMIAGALVNHDDIHRSLFYPDVSFPSGKKLSADELIFYSQLPQAQSTEAEMMTRYDDGDLDGIKNALQRIHVTGGTNGILIKALRRHRPFTPTVIGRAEDQAYLLSVLFSREPALRYLHKPGLIMRHDKHIFAGEAIEAAAVGKRIGDYIRILLFSYYGEALPWPVEKIKEVIDPFTGCFMSRIPLTVVYLRFAFEILARIQKGETGQALEFTQLGARRLNKVLDWLLYGENPLQEVYRQEKAGWDLYYDILDMAEEKLRQDEAFAKEMRGKVKNIMDDCFVGTD